MDGADDPALVLGDQESPLAGRHAIGHATPERHGLGLVERMHEADRGAVVDAVDQEIRQGVDLGVVDRVEGVGWSRRGECSTSSPGARGIGGIIAGAIVRLLGSADEEERRRDQRR